MTILIITYDRALSSRSRTVVIRSRRNANNTNPHNHVHIIKGARMLTNPTEIEAKWQEKWYAAKINEADRDDRKKFMMIFAYPGVTGYLHVGHMRGFSYVDDMSRYMRMQGYNVMFPVGTHATGNGPISLAKRVREKGREYDLLPPSQRLPGREAGRPHGPGQGGRVLQRGLCQSVLAPLRFPGRLEALRLHRA